MIQIKILLFDLDGTLIDSRKDLCRSINLMLADLDRPQLEESMIASFVGDGVWVLVRRSLVASDRDRQNPSDELHSKGLSLMREHYSREMLASTDLYPGVEETLERFDGKQCALVTSKESDFAKTILDRLGISRYFDFVVGGEMVVERKPHPKPVLLALDHFGEDPAAALMIGDSENDILAGKAAGTNTCGVTYGFRTRDQLRTSGPDYLIDRLEELADYFN